MHAFTIQRDPRNFSRPDAFWPERWLRPSSAHSPKGDATADDEAPQVHNEGAFIPFSYGPFNCVGKQLALHEIRVVVIALLQRFRVRRAREDVSVEEWWAEYFKNGGAKSYRAPE